MNKLLLVSLSFMAALAILAIASGNGFATLSTEYGSNFSGETGGTPQDTGIAGDIIGSFSDAPAFILFVVGILGLALLGGWSIFGSGPSEIAGTAIFQGGAFMSIYALLSGFAWNWFDDMGQIGGYAWLGITFFYAVGVISQAKSGGD